MMTRVRKALAHDGGTSLIELLVVMVIFGIVLSIVTSGIIAMLRQQQKQIAVGDNLDGSRKVIETLDRQVRYAYAITAPGTGSDGSDYVEWQSENVNRQSICTQWRFVPTTGQVLSRSWNPPNASTVTPWVLVAANIKQTGTAPIWSLTATSHFAPSPAPTATATPTATPTTADDREELTMQFSADNGHPATVSSSQVTITAINSSSASPPTNVCNEVARHA